MEDVYVICKDEFYHHGIKGMRWGVRRYQNPDGTLTDRGVKRYAKKGFADDVGDWLAGSTYRNASEKRRRSRAERYVKELQKSTTKEKAQKMAKRAVRKGANAASALLTLAIVDDVYAGGAGRRLAAKAIKNTGRAVVTAYVMARGGHDIRWYN